MFLLKYAIRAVVYIVVFGCFVAILPIIAPIYLVAWAFDLDLDQM